MFHTTDFHDFTTSQDGFEFTVKHIPVGLAYADKDLSTMELNQYYQAKISISYNRSREIIVFNGGFNSFTAKKDIRLHKGVNQGKMVLRLMDRSRNSVQMQL